MRTTCSIDDDVLAAAKAIAVNEKTTLGEVLSRLARMALRPNAPPEQTRNAVPLLSIRPGAARVTPELVKQLGEELP